MRRSESTLRLVSRYEFVEFPDAITKPQSDGVRRGHRPQRRLAAFPLQLLKRHLVEVRMSPTEELLVGGELIRILICLHREISECPCRRPTRLVFAAIEHARWIQAR